MLRVNEAAPLRSENLAIHEGGNGAAGGRAGRKKSPRARAASGAKTRGDGIGGRRGRANSALPYRVNGGESKKRPHAQLRRMGHPVEKRGSTAGPNGGRRGKSPTRKGGVWREDARDGNGGRRGRASAALPYKVNGADSKKKPHAQLRRMGHPFEKRGRRRGRTEMQIPRRTPRNDRFFGRRYRKVHGAGFKRLGFGRCAIVF